MDQENHSVRFFTEDPKLSPRAISELANGHEMPAIFEWYQYAGLIVHHVAALSDESPALLLGARGWMVVRALLHRCARLMLANVALTHEGLFGDAAKIIDRCIFESAVKARWLAKSKEIDRFLATSLRPELVFKEELQRHIQDQGGTASPIQTRMLSSMERHREMAGVSWEDVASARKLAPLDQMLKTVGDNPLVYIVSQQLGSHAVHGSWPSLLEDYLEVRATGDVGLRDHDVEPHPAQFASTIIHVLAACRDVIEHSFELEAGQPLVTALTARRDAFRTFYASTVT